MNRTLEANEDVLGITEQDTQALEVRTPDPMTVLQTAVLKGAPIETIERLVALQERASAKQAEIEFNLAMNAAQQELGRVAPDLTNPQTRSQYASYAALDRKIRPVYTKHGFSLSFDTGEAQPETVLVLCYVSHKAGHTRTYRSLMPSDGKGAKGGDVMTKTHATGAAQSYGMRYLLKMIFNIAVGEEDTDGNGAPGLGELATDEYLATIRDAADLVELQRNFAAAWKAAKAAKDDNAQFLFNRAKDERKAQLR